MDQLAVVAGMERTNDYAETLNPPKTWTNALQNRCYMCIQWTRALYSVVITGHSNPPISQFNSLCNEFTSVWSMFVHITSFFNNISHL